MNWMCLQWERWERCLRQGPFSGCFQNKSHLVKNPLLKLLKRSGIVQIQQAIQITPGTSLGSLSSPTSTPEIDNGGPEPSNALSLCNSQSALDVRSDGAHSELLVSKTLSVIFFKSTSDLSYKQMELFHFDLCRLDCVWLIRKRFRKYTKWPPDPLAKGRL